LVALVCKAFVALALARRSRCCARCTISCARRVIERCSNATTTWSEDDVNDLVLVASAPASLIYFAFGHSRSVAHFAGAQSEVNSLARPTNRAIVHPHTIP